MTNETRETSAALRIAVDFDGVLFDHVPYVLRGFRDRYGIDLEAEGMRHWDYFQYRAVQEKDLSWSCVHDVLRDIETDLKLHEEPPRDALAPRVIANWINAGHRVDIVTARHPESEAATRHFLRRNGIRFHSLVMGARAKTGWDILIDDAPHNVLMAAAAGGHALLMDHPYNRDVPALRNPRRVRTWNDVAVQVEEHQARPMHIHINIPVSLPGRPQLLA